MFFIFCFFSLLPFLHFESAEAELDAKAEAAAAAADSHCQMSLLMHDLDFRTAYDDVRRMTKDWIDPCSSAPLLPLLALLCALCRCLGASVWLRHAKICNEREMETEREREAGRGRSLLCCQFSISFSCELLTTIVAAAAKMRLAPPLSLPPCTSSPHLALITVYCCKSLHKMPHTWDDVAADVALDSTRLDAKCHTHCKCLRFCPKWNVATMHNW